jgi:type IV secretion system protein VirD4
MLGQVSRTYQEVQRPLLTPDECLRMPGPKKNAAGRNREAGDMVIYVAGYPAIYGKQPLYFKDPTFQARAASVPAPKVSDRFRLIPDAGEGITI